MNYSNSLSWCLWLAMSPLSSLSCFSANQIPEPIFIFWSWPSWPLQILLLIMTVALQSPPPTGLVSLYFFFFFINLFIYFWLCWVFVAVCRLSLVAMSGGYASWALGARASVVMAHGL